MAGRTSSLRDQTAQRGRGNNRALQVARCSLCGLERPIGLMVPDGGEACADLRWYCKDARSCTERWTSRLGEPAGTAPTARSAPTAPSALAGTALASTAPARQQEQQEHRENQEPAEPGPGWPDEPWPAGMAAGQRA